MNDLEAINDILSLEYKGENADLGRMNSYQAAKSIIAFSDYLSAIAKNIYGEKIELTTDIQGIRGESFDIDFYLAIGSYAVSTAPDGHLKIPHPWPGQNPPPRWSAERV